MLRQDVTGSVLTLLLDRPEVGNALSGELVEAMETAIAAAATDASIRAIVVGGTGKHFSAGADLNYMRSMRHAGHAANVADAKRTQRLFAVLGELPKPVVARVNGPARGGGVGLLAATDVVVAVKNANFAFSEVRLGIIPAMIAPFVIARLGPARARRLFLTGEVFDADQAQAWGLVDHVVPPEDLDATVAKVCVELMRGAPGALGEVKRLVPAVVAAAPHEVADLTAEWIARLRAGDEGEEGMKGFLEKRPPRWVP